MCHRHLTCVYTVLTSSPASLPSSPSRMHCHGRLARHARLISRTRVTRITMQAVWRTLDNQRCGGGRKPEQLTTIIKTNFPPYNRENAAATGRREEVFHDACFYGRYSRETNKRFVRIQTKYKKKK